MFVNVGRFRFRPMSQEEWQGLQRGIEREFAPLPQRNPAFHGVYLTRPSDDELMLVWFWDSQADLVAAQPGFQPFLQEHVAPKLAQAPERTGGEVVAQITR